MKDTTHTIGDLIAVFGDLLHYVRTDAEALSESEQDDDETSPISLYERGQAVYDATALWRLLHAAPQLLDACYGALELKCPDRDDRECGGVAAIREAIEAATGTHV